VAKNNGSAHHYRFNAAMIGGTFDRLHTGHKYYINQAFKDARKVVVHLSTDKHVAFLGKTNVLPFDQRKKMLQQYIESIKNSQQYEIKPVSCNDELKKFCVEEIDLDLVLAAEKKYIERFRRLNQIRYKKIGKRYHVEKVKIIANRYGQKISSHNLSRYQRFCSQLDYFICWLKSLFTNDKHHTKKSFLLSH
jgi:pantetheine-phosphate adenylyltransferase